MKKYVVKDVFLGLKLAFSHIIHTMIFVAIGLFVFAVIKQPKLANSSKNHWENNDNIHYIIIAVIGIIAIQSLLIYFANSRYTVDFKNKKFIFPRSDVENSILAILFCVPYFNLMRTQSIDFEALEQVYLDREYQRGTSKVNWFSNSKAAKAKKLRAIIYFFLKSIFYPWWRKRINTRYNLNILGEFGSAHLQFSSRQKRDELRNNLNKAIRSTGRKQDRKIAEFD